MTTIAGAAPGTGRNTSSRSNSISQAVIVVSGRAAACASDKVVGAFAAIRASTQWYSALTPGLSSAPA